MRCSPEALLASLEGGGTLSRILDEQEPSCVMPRGHPPAASISETQAT